MVRWCIQLIQLLRQKNGADPTEAAPDLTNRGAGLVKIRSSRQRDSACVNGSKGVEGLRYDLRCEGELKSSCTCFPSSCFAEVPSIFFLVLPLPGRHTTDCTLAQCRCECLSSSQICSHQIQFLKVSRTGVRDKRGLNWPWLITVLVDKAREKCCHQTDSYLYLLRERSR